MNEKLELSICGCRCDLYKAYAPNCDVFKQRCGSFPEEMKKDFDMDEYSEYILAYGNETRLKEYKSKRELLKQAGVEIMRFMRGKYALDEVGNGKDELAFLDGDETVLTIFFSSHVLGEVQKICGRVAIIKEGKVINIQDISDLRKNAYKHVQLSALSSISKGCFDIPGIADLKQQGTSASFMFMGDVAEIIRKLNDLDINDILIEEPTLEEIFMHYYQ